MNAHVLQHVPFEDIGSIASWLDMSDFNVSYTRFFEDAALPRVADLDLIIIMGGPMSVNDEKAFPWLCAEKEFIRHAVNAGVPLLGICLGAQLIANALGANVYKNRCREIGWFPIRALAGSPGAFSFPDKSFAFHWHGETFDLPVGAVHLAKSDVCENQAFQVGRHVIGLQFHLEATPESVEAMASNCADELVDGPFVQTKSQIMSMGRETYSSINNVMDGILAYLTNGVDAV